RMTKSCQSISKARITTPSPFSFFLVRVDFCTEVSGDNPPAVPRARWRAGYRSARGGRGGGRWRVGVLAGWRARPARGDWARQKTDPRRLPFGGRVSDSQPEASRRLRVGCL